MTRKRDDTSDIVCNFSGFWTIRFHKIEIKISADFRILFHTYLFGKHQSCVRKNATFFLPRKLYFSQENLKVQAFNIVLLYSSQTLSAKGLTHIPHAQQASKQLLNPFKTFISTHPEYHLGLQVSAEKNPSIQHPWRRVSESLASTYIHLHHVFLRHTLCFTAHGDACNGYSFFFLESISTWSKRLDFFSSF